MDATGKSSAVTVIEPVDVPQAFVPLTVYVPPAVTTMEVVVSPVDQT